MKKIFSHKLFPVIIVIFVISSFFLPKILTGHIPIPADSLIGLYHPFRDKSFDGFAPGKYPVKNPLITDPVIQTYPWKKLAIDNIKNGKWPLWNPYSFSGQPLMANIQTAPFNITNILFFILPFNIAWSAYIILPQILTGLFMYIFLKSLKLSSISSLFGAVVLPFTGYFVAWMTWGGITSTAMYLPLLLYCTNNTFKRISPWIFLVLIFSVSQVILSGHWQTGSYILLVLIIFSFYRYLQSKNIKSLILTGIAIILGVIISAVQIIPSLEFILLSGRDFDQSFYLDREDWFVPYQHLIQIIAPDFFGNPVTQNYWGVFNYAEFVSYIGIFPLTFALIALLGKKRKTMFFLIIGLIAMIFTIKNPISILPYSLSIPFISSMQPSRMIFVLIFSLVSLASFGLEYILDNKSKKMAILSPLLILFLLLTAMILTTQVNLFPQMNNLITHQIAQRNLILPIVLSSLGLIIIIFLSHLKRKNIILAVIFVVTIFDLFRFANKFIPFSKSNIIIPQTEITSYLTSVERPFRILTTDRRIFHPNILANYKVESTHGYDPLFLNDYAKFVSSWESNKLTEPGSFNRIVTPANYETNIIDMLNIKFIISFDEIKGEKFEKVLEEGITKIYKNNSVLPRAYFVSEIIQTDNRDITLEKMVNENFDPKTTAFSSSVSFPKNKNTSSVLIKKYSDQSMTLEVNTIDDAPLVMSNVHYPGWKAYIDGVETKIEKVNFMFQSIIVPSGVHTIEVKYQPESFFYGLIISIVGIFLSLVAFLYIWKKRYQ